MTAFFLPKAGFIQILSPGKSGTPPCKSGQLEKDLELEVSSVRHAARLIIFEIMILMSPLNLLPLPDPTHAVWIGSDISAINLGFGADRYRIHAGGGSRTKE